MDWRDNIETASKRISGHVRRTPVMEAAAFGLHSSIELKFEHMQHTGSFKARGAFNTLLSNSVPEAGVVAASGGNHGAAVAYAAAKLGRKSRIYVPEMAGSAKISLIRRQGAELRVVPGEYSSAMSEAREYETRTGAMQIHAYDAPDTIAGQGTLMREWERQGLKADTVLIAVGGGGLVAGSMAWLQGRRKIVAVEPETSPALNAALKAGKPVDVDVSGIAANALGARSAGSICFQLARELAVESVLVSDDAIRCAQTALWRDLRQMVEPAGATALAALISKSYMPEKNERISVLVCGGNTEPDHFNGGG
ncbi:MAG: threonine/serine dehydratase [Roseovarius sp.]|nr:threonine/serine dehydratase [Roseovarius sp.]